MVMLGSSYHNDEEGYGTRQPHTEKEGKRTFWRTKRVVIWSRSVGHGAGLTRVVHTLVRPVAGPGPVATFPAGTRC